jgi:hypothetical protein
MISKLKNKLWRPISGKWWDFYWRHYQHPVMRTLEDAKQQPGPYLRVLAQWALNRLFFRKTAVVFLLTRGHLSWIEGILEKLIREKSFSLLIFTHDRLLASKLGRSRYVHYVDLTKSVHHLHMLTAPVGDIYITAASVTGAHAPLISPKVMFFHSLVSVNFVYEDDTFSNYQYVFCATPYQVDELKEWYRVRNLRGKCLIPGGYPKLDALLTKRADRGSKRAPGRRIIFAPTLLNAKSQKYSALFAAGEQILGALLNSGEEVVFRPHPINLETSDPHARFVHSLVEKFKSRQNFTLDKSVDYFESYESSDLMVTDFSGTAFTYGLSFERPVIFYSANEEEAAKEPGVEFTCRHELGAVVTDVNELFPACETIFSNYESMRSQLLKFRKHFIFNLRASEDYFVKNISYILNNKRHPEWIYLD